MVSLIIPAYNAKPHLERLLLSLPAGSCRPEQIIVIDNGSDDQTAEFMRTHWPKIELIHNEINQGASFARNQGIDRAQGEYILLADCDVEFTDDFFIQLKDLLNRIPEKVAAISPQIIQADSQKIFSCGLFISSLYRTYDLRKNEARLNGTEPFTIHGPNSCCALFRRRSLGHIKKLTYFDNDFFFLVEDADLALRLKEAGLECLCFPQLVCRHHGQSSGFSCQRRRYFSFRNRIYMIIKYRRTKGFLRFFLRSFLYDIPRTVHFFLTNRYAKNLFRDVRQKWKNEKTHHI